MSLQPQKIEAVPAETVRIARAAFAKGNLCLKLRDELGTIYEDEHFADLFSKEGQPALAPWRLTLVSILQFVEGLCDRQAANMVRSRLDWKYLLGLELSEGGFDYSVLAEYQGRLLAGEAEKLLLRLYQATPEFKELSDLRAGIEGTLSQAVRVFELRHTRYRGLAKTHLQHLLTAVALNLVWVYAWLSEVPRAKTRVSRLAALKPAA